QAGVTLQLFDGDTAPTTPAAGVTTNTCVSDTDGDCSWVIPNTQAAGPGPAGANRNRRFWIQQITPPAPGTFTNPSLNTTGNGIVISPYRFRTGTQLQAGVSYSS